MDRSRPFPQLRRPLVAILRGLTPATADAVVETLVAAGFGAIEVPLNSPDPFRSIEIARRTAPEACLIGAGTVVDPADVDRLAEAGGTLLVSPNVDPAVLARAARHGMVTLPGVFTATEAFAAIRAGASALKFFPASLLGPGGIRALGAVLPKDVPLCAVGGVSEIDFADYLAAGIAMFGLGSSLYRPGDTIADVAPRAHAAIERWDAIGGDTRTA